MGVFILASMFPNGFSPDISRLFDRVLKVRGRFAFVASNFDSLHDVTDRYFDFFSGMFGEAGIHFAESAVVDGRMTLDEMRKTVQRADVVWLSGGDTPLQYECFKKYGLCDSIRNHGGTVIGLSAGAINLGKKAVCAVSSGHKKLEVYDALGCVDISAVPHFSAADFSDELKDISERFLLYGICDDAAVVCEGSHTEFCGDVYVLRGRCLEQVSRR